MTKDSTTYIMQVDYNLYQQRLIDQQVFQQQLMMEQNIVVGPVASPSALANTPTPTGREQLERGSWNGPAAAYFSRREGN
ncbi:hypothetical protein Y032_0014g2265 [Ancylostoma ceylanicum]|uniref:Uncharacterized protein n=1 Tax=Ancylostoma ceylanicum TaxID=53326 RepID=A0A016V9A2_9BILA|nr:hypothetical protein Y032_0014g2265 [Ancylostoma ceylanicum]